MAISSKKQNGIADEDIYNFNKTGFAMGLVATAKVVTRSDCIGKPFLIQPGNREWVTLIKYINASGWALPPYIIVKGKMYMEAWYKGNVPHFWRINTSPNGWTSNEIGLHWLEYYFISLIKKRRVGKYSLLILDGHNSYLTPRFNEICSQNSIVFICMPPHSSHLCQPLDVACFAPLKKAYGGLIKRLIRQEIYYINKVDFLDTFPKARELAFKKSSIQNVFSASGLVSFQPDEMLGKLMYSLREITPTESQTTTSSILKTSKNTRQLKKHETTIERLLRERTRSPPESIRTALLYIIKGCEIALNRAALFKQKNHDLQTADEYQTKKRKQSNRQLADLEGATVHKAIQLFRRAREEDETLEI
ncbi:hypothetical protein ASPACDRAFT_122421 [Aspergillus aculeatus ATCC 16872]|uniref:DDE-1 domain-containing protein n=1 Tax=Aspergillus aculeatus (strain ATCC 16872 / CBS 172.66 / WB 5094) TaxID=690307 RepID=A0A1L9WQW2_ASPA1|nr:uncharacterized protein ASPACDRAFT_122421 [Aspergillus aculeatus ATCC 16872]OJJ98564.1 hypothetical protein ASPACDRAFT_122421 [Aspergillus aculeatus ATCC 16872]